MRCAVLGALTLWFDDIAAHNWLPEGTSGEWSVRRRIVEGDRAEWLRLMGDKQEGMSPPGVYTELYEGSIRRMSDDVFLLERDREFAARAKGSILLTGLGLGIMAAWLAKKAEVNQVHVVEISEDVISLVAPYLPAKVKVFHADAYSFAPPTNYDCALHDCFAEKPENVDALMKNYQKHTRWQGVSTYGN